MRKWYSALWTLTLPIVLAGFTFKLRHHPEKLSRCKNWLGFGSPVAKKQGIWIHAASVGEVRAALPLIQAIRKLTPNTTLIITTQSATGQSTVKTLLGSQVIAQYCPLDTTAACKRFLQHYQPRLVIILETEIWPNLLHQLTIKKIPVILANARLSNKSVDAYRQWQSLFKPALNSFTHIFAQSEQDALRFLGLGIERRILSISGNLKYDVHQEATVADEGFALRQAIGMNRPVWIAASTHDFEEEAILSAFQILKQQVPNLFLIIVPRHPERFQPLAKQLQHSSYRLSLMSTGASDLDKSDILLCDVMGKLIMLYHASDVAFIGGSLGQGQGHNPLEAAYANCAITTGYCVSSFAEICENLALHKALLQVHDIAHLTKTTLHLLQTPERRLQMIEAAKNCVLQHQGAVDKHMALIQSWC